MTPKRSTKDEYYLNIAREVSLHSTCFRRAIGAIIIRDDQIISTGYAGAPRKTKDSLDHGYCLRDKLNIPHGHRYELCRSVHAEQNTIINAARAGVSLLGGDMYLYASKPGENKPLNAFPCFICKKMIINAGLSRVICSADEGKMKIFLVRDWVKDWQKNDIVDDRQQYG
jgi:dCMP deaminase